MNGHSYSFNPNITLTTDTISIPNIQGELTYDTNTGDITICTGDNIWQSITTIDDYNSNVLSTSNAFEDFHEAIEKLETKRIEIGKVTRVGNKIIVEWKDNTTTTYEGAPSEYLSDKELLYRAFSQKLFSNDSGKLKSSMETALFKLIREEEEISW